MAPVSWLLDFLLPRRCPLCDDIVSSEGLLCAKCWPLLDHISQPWCDCCGMPFVELSPSLPDDTPLQCAACLAHPPYFDKARSSFVYNDVSKQLILSFKHGDRTDLAPTLAQWMFQHHKELIAQADYLIPVPLHWRRLLKRRYNQASLLSHQLTHLSGVPTLSYALLRKVHTPSQGQVSGKKRKKNVQDVFALKSKYDSVIKDKSIIIIDDVLTTGSTVNNCAKVLKKLQAKGVYVLTFARVVHSSNIE